MHDPVTGKVARHANGTPKTIGLMHPMPEYWALVEKNRKVAAFWQGVKDEREARRVLAEQEAAAGMVGM